MEAIEVKGIVNNKGELIINDVLPVKNKHVRVMLLFEENDRNDWLQTSVSRLSQAYGKEEPEYSLNMVKEQNPNYKKHEKR